MAKTTSAEKSSSEAAEDKCEDGLEIISIGSLYKGRWDKKYWSSSRGKDRYPYPVGFQAIRAYNGTTYKMEIHEGASGPTFVITSADGYSCSGKTPDIAWQGFQKKGYPGMKIWHGKRLSSKMYGLELFGFKNSFVQKLLRELVTDLNGIAEQRLSLCNDTSILVLDDSRQNVCTHPDLISCLGRPQVKGKTGKRCGSKNVKLHGGKKARPEELTGSSITSIKRQVSEENKDQNTGVSASMHITPSVGQSPNCFPPKMNFSSSQIIFGDQEGRIVHEEISGFVDSKNSLDVEITDSFSKEDYFHRSCKAEVNTSKFLLAIENNKEPKDCCDIDICAPDAINYAQENTSNSVPSTLDKNACNERGYHIASGETLSIEVNDVAKSMMAVLLPQMIPFLKDSATEKLTIGPSVNLPSILNSSQEDNKIGNLLEASSSVVTKNAYVEKEEMMHVNTTGVGLVADSFENSECESHKSDQAVLRSDIAEASRVVFDRETCSPISHEQHGSDVLLNKNSDCHTTPELTRNKFHHPSKLDSEYFPQDFDICIPDSVLEHKPPLDRVISESNNDACTTMNENSNKVGFDLGEKDHEAAHGYEICVSHSVLKDLPPEDRVVSKSSSGVYTDMKKNSKQIGLNSMQNNQNTAIDLDRCIPDSILEYKPPLDRVISKCNKDFCSNMEENSNQVRLNSMERGFKTAHDLDICIPDSVLEDTPPPDRVVSESNDDACTFMEEIPKQNESTSVEDPKAANDFDICITDSFLEDTPHPNRVVSKSNDDACTNMKEISNQIGLYSMEKDDNVALDLGLCIPDSVQEHTPPLDGIISRSNNDRCTDMEQCLNQVGLNSLEKDHRTAHDFTGDISNARERITEDKVVVKTKTETMVLPSIQAPIISYKRRKSRTADPHSDCCPQNSKTDKDGGLGTFEKNISKGWPPSETIELHAYGNKLCDPVLLGNQERDEVQSDELERDNSVTDSEIKQCLVMSDNGPNVGTSQENVLCRDDLSASHVETPPVRSDLLVSYSQNAELNNSIPCWDPKPSSCENNCSSKEAQVISELNSHRNDVINDNLGKIMKFVGCYFLPMPVSSLFLSRRENEILVCVICGHVVDQKRTLFTYKVSVMETNLGCPSFIAYTSLLLPDPKHNFTRETLVERCGVQLTPDGQYIVLLGSIKTPNCRERKISCDCSSCMSVCSEESALKIVKVEHGYVSVVATLRTAEIVHCFLIFEPNLLCSVGESGRLHIWVMNSTWRNKVEDFIIPADDSMSPGIVELKRIPKCTHLVVAFNSIGEFSLWDISNRNCVSIFSASTNPFIQFLPISVFDCQRSSLGFPSTSVGEQVDQHMGATHLWFTDQEEPCSFHTSEEGDIAMCLLVSTFSDIESPHDFTSSHCQINTATSWRLALLVKDDMILGSSFNIRPAAIGVLGSYGIISTPDGLVYIWELCGGSKIGTLHPFQDGTATCIATDESMGGALGLAGGEGQLLIYVPHNELDNAD